MLDASAQHAGRTGREILTIAQQIMGVPASRVDEMLDLVSLSGAEADRRVGNYSLGMRQRLGIAAALIGDPVGAHPGRAGQRARPGRHPLDAGPAPRLRRPRGDRPAVLPPAGRDRDNRRRHRDDRAGTDRLPGLQGRAPRRRRDRRPRPRTSSPSSVHCGAAGLDVDRLRGRSLCAPMPSPALVGRAAYDGRRGAHRAPHRRQRRPRGDVPRAHRRHPTRRGQRHDRHHHRPRFSTGRPYRAAPIPLEPGRPRRAPQDVRHPLGLLADREHRHRRPDRHHRDHRLRAGPGPDLLQLRQGDRVPDDGDPADGRPAVHHQRVEPAQRA